jgi:hypothetical protein
MTKKAEKRKREAGDKQKIGKKWAKTKKKHKNKQISE